MHPKASNLIIWLHRFNSNCSGRTASLSNLKVLNWGPKLLPPSLRLHKVMVHLKPRSIATLQWWHVFLRKFSQPLGRPLTAKFYGFHHVPLRLCNVAPSFNMFKSSWMSPILTIKAVISWAVSIGAEGASPNLLLLSSSLIACVSFPWMRADPYIYFFLTMNHESEIIWECLRYIWESQVQDSFACLLASLQRGWAKW